MPLDIRCLQSSPFFKLPLTTVINFNLSRLSSYCIFVLYTSVHAVTGSTSLSSSIRNIWLLIRFLISFEVALSQAFLKNSWVIVWNVTLLSLIILIPAMNYLIIPQQPWRPFVNLFPYFHWEFRSFPFTLRFPNTVTYFKSIISWVNIQMHMVSIPKFPQKYSYL